MKLNIHDTTPASKTPKWLKTIFIIVFSLLYSIFALMAFVLVYYAGAIWGAIVIALIPFIFLALVLWNSQNLSKSYIEVSTEDITVVEYPFGRKRVVHISYTEIHHAELIRPHSMKLRGPRIRDVGIPYIVFYDENEKQLFKILAYPPALEFQESITTLK